MQARSICCEFSYLRYNFQNIFIFSYLVFRLKVIHKKNLGNWGNQKCKWIHNMLCYNNINIYPCIKRNRLLALTRVIFHFAYLPFTGFLSFCDSASLLNRLMKQCLGETSTACHVALQARSELSPDTAGLSCAKYVPAVLGKSKSIITTMELIYRKRMNSIQFVHRPLSNDSTKGKTRPKSFSYYLGLHQKMLDHWQTIHTII